MDSGRRAEKSNYRRISFRLRDTHPDAGLPAGALCGPIGRIRPDAFDRNTNDGVHHSRFRNHDWARRLNNVPVLRIHPATAERKHVSDGGRVWIEVPAGLVAPA